MKLLGIGSDLGTGKVTGILKNKVEVSYQDGTIEFISFKEAERRVYIYSLQGWKSVSVSYTHLTLPTNDQV